MPREHGEDGAFVETVTLEDVLETFDHVRGPVILSADVADRLGCSRETARRKLTELYERGDVDRRKVSRRVVYWRVDEPDASSSLQERVSASTGAADRSGGVGQEPRETADRRDEHASPADTADVDREQLRDALPGSGEVLEARVDAILAMYRHLQDHGHAEKSDLLAVVDADAVGYASPDSVWANMVKGRDTLRALPGVETPPTGRTRWRFADEDVEGPGNGGVYDPTEEF
jgi:DNA-binding Lrp family transcriptional regulator